MKTTIITLITLLASSANVFSENIIEHTADGWSHYSDTATAFGFHVSVVDQDYTLKTDSNQHITYDDGETWSDKESGELHVDIILLKMGFSTQHGNLTTTVNLGTSINNAYETQSDLPMTYWDQDDKRHIDRETLEIDFVYKIKNNFSIAGGFLMNNLTIEANTYHDPRYELNYEKYGIYAGGAYSKTMTYGTFMAKAAISKSNGRFYDNYNAEYDIEIKGLVRAIELSASWHGIISGRLGYFAEIHKTQNKMYDSKNVNSVYDYSTFHAEETIDSLTLGLSYSI